MQVVVIVELVIINYHTNRNVGRASIDITRQTYWPLRSTTKRNNIIYLIFVIRITRYGLTFVSRPACETNKNRTIPPRAGTYNRCT